MSPQRKLLSSEDDICKPLNEDNPDPNDLCVRIKEVMATIEEVTKQINDGDVTEETLDTLTDQSEKLQEVVNEVEKNPELIDEYQINKEEMKKKTEDVKKEIDSALDTVTDKIDGPADSNVVAIVLGVIGGLIVVVLVAVGGYMGYRKHQQRQKKPKTMNYDMLEEGGQNNPAFQMDRQQSGPSHQP
ncbi:uncharacterized protein LOC123501644 [Portunus trituberculatus]|uniref:uncharacterized protein LOC123501644 n=1 Tax=Portunus trituberculatus TaxID=210409 RepID=UPI001E1CFA8D|nr:uncharacterized protein LOC123501644 [Portunus trituberculatus]